MTFIIELFIICNFWGCFSFTLEWNLWFQVENCVTWNMDSHLSALYQLCVQEEWTQDHTFRKIENLLDYLNEYWKINYYLDRHDNIHFYQRIL